MFHRLAFCVGAICATLLAPPASAQIKPASSGALSFNAPEMRRHGSGFHRPNRPHHRRRHHLRHHPFFGAQRYYR